MGRTKVDVSETPLLQLSAKNSSAQAGNVVEMFTPHRPS
jgi:hypothetical protein